VDILHVGRNDQAGYFYYVMELADDSSAECGVRNAELSQGSSASVPHSELRTPHSINPGPYSPKTLRSELFHRGRLPLEECLQIGLTLTSALAHLHKHGLVHRDIKPSNIIFVNGIPKLADLGLVAHVGQTMSFVGTEGYLPPEGPGSPQADIYSLGKVLYEISTGKDRQEFPELPTHLDALRQKEELVEFNEVLVKACHADAKKRYATAQEMHADLVMLQSGKSVVRLRTLERRLTLASRVGIAAMIVALVTGAAFYMARRTAKVTAQHLVKWSTANGVRLMEERDLFNSLVWFTEALRLDQGNRDREYVHRLRIGSILQQCPKLVGIGFHQGSIHHLEFSPDGRRLVTASGDRTARVWDAHTGEPLTPPLRHSAEVGYASFSSDGSRVVIATEATAQVWNAENAEPIGPPLKHKGWFVEHAAFSPDGQRVCTISSAIDYRRGESPGEAVIWNAATGERIAAWTKGAAFSPDGQQILTINPDPQSSEIDLAQVWDTNTGQPITPPMKVPSYSRAAFSPDGRSLALASALAGTRVWSTRTGQPITSPLRDEGRYSSAFYSPDSRLLVTSDWWRAARVWDTATGEPVTPRLYHNLNSVQFSPDNRYVLTCGKDGKARLWEIATGKSVSVPLTHGDGISHASFSPDGRQVAAGGYDGTVRIWNLAALHGPALDLTEAPEVLHVYQRNRAAFSPDGRRVATIGDDAAVRIRDAQSGKMLLPPLWHSVLPSDHNRFSSLVFSRDGTRIGSQSYYHVTDERQERLDLFEARVWDAATGKQLTPTLQIEGAGVASVKQAYFDPDCKRLLVLRQTNQVEIWDMATAKLATPPLKHAGLVSPRSELVFRSAAFSPDGSRIVTTDFLKRGETRSGNVHVWMADTGEKVGAPFEFTEDTKTSRPWVAYQFWLKYIGFSPDGKRVVAVTLDNSAHLLDAQTGRLLLSFRTQRGHLERVVFSPDGRRLLTEGTDGATRILDAATSNPLTPILPNADAVWCDSFSRDGRTVLTASGPEAGWPRVWDAQTGEPILPHPPPYFTVGWTELSSDARRVLMATGGGHVRVCELNEDRRPPEDLILLARVLSGQVIDANGNLSPLAPAALSNAWQRLRLKYPAAFTATADDLIRWDWSEVWASIHAKQWSAALFHLGDLIKAQATNVRYWSRRGYVHATMTNWHTAAADFSEAVRLGVTERRMLKSCALAQLAAGDSEGYRKTCEALLKTLAEPDGLRAGPEVALVCLLATNTLTEVQDLQAFIERGASDKAWGPYYHLPLGMLLYRTQRFAEALRELNEAVAVADKKGLSPAWPLLALAHYRLGQTDEARQWLTKATKEFDADSESKASEGTFEPPRWEKRLTLDLLLREASQLIALQVK
ncbi:MAG: protein kinase, partial [Verrucomicrobia bacterium]|nr:protein kinase [Verrucomicrobiota bacterium]